MGVCVCLCVSVCVCVCVCTVRLYVAAITQQKGVINA